MEVISTWMETVGGPATWHKLAVGSVSVCVCVWGAGGGGGADL